MVCEKIESCKVTYTKTRHTFTDNKGCNSKFEILNQNRKEFSTYDFENCVFENNDTKCDFGLTTLDGIYFIELKGSETLKGIKQILATYSETKKCFKQLRPKARLIVSKVSKPDLVRRSKEYRELARAFNNQILIRQRIYSETI
ncbi:MAG: hypothetical protein WBG71_05425 [Leeuwenhoekiella sp.]